jgi:CTP:molybdopterin cytidylyltransferase MocA
MVSDVRIVVGKNLPAYLEAMPELAPCLVDDPRCALGPFGSLCAGIEALAPYVWEQLLVLPMDVPCCAPSIIALLRAVSAEAAVPRHGGYGGHPVLLSRALAESLLALEPSTSRLDHVLRGLPVGARRDIDVDDPDVIADLNTPAAVLEYEATRQAR